MTSETQQALDKRSRRDLLAQIQRDSRPLMLSKEFVLTCEDNATAKQLEFVADLLANELRLRDENKRRRLIARAGFPFLKTFEGYVPEQVQFPAGLSLGDVQDLSFVSEKMNLVLFGPVGTGKTHMAIAAGVRACQQGLKTKFYTVAQLIRLLSTAAASGKLEKLLSELRALSLLILDEWGYVPVDRPGAQLLFQVISDSYESKSLIITTNLEFSRWGSVLTDEQMAAAMIDRLIHHGHMILFDGQSYRMRNALMRQDINK